jgi:hypothetical protein
MNINQPLTSGQKENLLGILPLGCDRATACKYVGATLPQLQAEMKRDRDFAQSVARAEAGVDLRHLRVVQKASEEENNWRPSAWWLERRARAQSADGHESSDARLIELLDELALAITTEIQDEELQRRVIERLLQTLADSEDLAAHSLPVEQASSVSTESPHLASPQDAQ